MLKKLKLERVTEIKIEVVSQKLMGWAFERLTWAWAHAGPPLRRQPQLAGRKGLRGITAVHAGVTHSDSQIHQMCS